MYRVPEETVRCFDAAMDVARVRLQDAGIRVLAGCPASGLKTPGRGDGCRHA